MNRLLGVGEGEVRRALRQLALVFVASAALVLLKAAQGGIFLAAYPRSAIPWAFAASALTLASLSALAVAGAARLGPVRLAGITLSGGAIGSLALRALLSLAPAGAPFAVYVVIEATAGLVLIQTWSVVSGTVDPRSARRILPIAGVGASVAWALGGLLVPRLVALVGAPGLLILAPLLLLGAAALVRTVARIDLAGAGARQTSARTGLLEGWRSGLSFVAEVPLMRVCMALSVLALLAEQLMDFQLLSSAGERFSSEAEITAFFGRFYGVTSALGLVFQVALSGRLLARLGAVRGLIVTPATTVLVALVALVVPGFLPLMFLRGSDRVLKGALFSSAMEQIQTPLPMVRRAQARALSRGVVAPLAYAVAALGLAALGARSDPRSLTLLTLLLSLVIAAVILLGLGRAYVLALRRTIDDRRLRLDEPRGEASVAPLDARAAEALARDLDGQDEGRALLAAELLGDADPAVAARPVLEPLLEREVQTGFRYLSLIAGVAHDDGTPDWEISAEFDFLGKELELRFRAARARVLQLLSLLASRKVTGSVEAGLRSATTLPYTPMEAQVAELLEMALPARLARRVVPLFDRLTLKERIFAAERVGLFDRQAMHDPLEWIVSEGDRTLRLCAMVSYGARAAERYPGVHSEDVHLIPLFEHMRFLRSVPLFAELLGDDLRSVAEILETVDKGPGSSVFQKGEPGEDMYVIAHGKVVIRDGAAEIATLGPREFFGELSVIDREARSASAVALEPTELLRLRAADLGELMARRPRIQEHILLVVVRRLRTLNARVAQ